MYMHTLLLLITIGVETYGTLGDKAKEFLKVCATRRAGSEERLIPQILFGYRARVAVAVQKGNGVSIDVWRSRCCYKGSVPGAAGAGG